MPNKLFDTNLSKIILLTDNNIYVSYNSIKIEIHIPNLFEILNDDRILLLASGLNNDNQVWLMNRLFRATNSYEYLIGILKYSKENYEDVFHLCFPRLNFNNNTLSCDGEIIPEEIMIKAIDVLLIGMDYKNFNDFYNEGDEDEMVSSFYKRKKELDDKIHKIKKDKEKNVDLDKRLVIIQYCFPNLSIEKLLTMNLFSITYYFIISQKILLQKVQDIAMGNGLNKNYKTLLEEV